MLLFCLLLSCVDCSVKHDAIWWLPDHIICLRPSLNEVTWMVWLITNTIVCLRVCVLGGDFGLLLYDFHISVILEAVCAAAEKVVYLACGKNKGLFRMSHHPPNMESMHHCEGAFKWKLLGRFNTRDGIGVSPSKRPKKIKGTHLILLHPFHTIEWF